MRLGVSIYYKAGDKFYNQLIEALKGLDFTELVSIQSKLLERYRNEFRVAYQGFKIDWNEVAGIPDEDIKVNDWGQPYDSKATLRVAKKVIEYSDKIVVVGQGDYYLNKLGEERGMIIEKSAKTQEKPKKKFKF